VKQSPLVSALVLLPLLGALAGDRVANTSITLPANPPTSVIEVENAFAGLSFSSPLCLRSPAGEARRLFVCEKTGDLELIPDVTAVTPTKTVFLDLDQIINNRGESFLTSSEQGLLSVAFHPDYANNGDFFVVYNVRSAGVNYQRLSRWNDPDTTDTVADPNSETILIEMENNASNHNGGDLQFGPDGYLYMSWGDEGNQNDSLNNSQFLDKDFWSSIIRIDVDLESEDYTASDGTGSDDDNLRPNNHPAVRLANGNPHYEIPADNPWVGVASFNGISVNPTQTRTEFFALGFRNPWRMSFDGYELWVGDVGQGAREEITLASIGTNHGWAWYEGDINGPKFSNTINGASRTSATHTPPVWAYNHGLGEFQGRSVTGGFVYRGGNVPSLTGKYIFSDYVSGNIWALKRNEIPGEPEVERIAGETGIAGFGPDPSNGDILMADLGNNVIRRIISRDLDSSFPETLSATGIFSNLTTLTPTPGVVPYEVNLPFWSDHALKQRWFAIKNTTDVINYSAKEPWTFPNGMIWVKHFDLELERGNPTTRKRIETRVIVRNQTGETSPVTLLSEGTPARYLIPTNSSLESIWPTPSFDDTGWPSATPGIGYDEDSTYLSEFGTGGNLGDSLNGENTSVYLRIPFDVADAAAIATLTLRMKYDDGFAAFLNGRPVASANAPETLTWQSGATGNNSDSSAVSFADFPIDAALLAEGQNVLAIQGLNNGIGSSDMLISPEIIGGRFTNFVDGIYGVSYRWNEAQTEATLVRSAGENIDLTINTPDGVRNQVWTIPSRASCLACHTEQAGFALSFNTPQLNHPGTIEGTSGNLLSLLHSSGYLDQDPGVPLALPKHITPENSTYSLEARVRSYLEVNCTYCHQQGGIEPESWFGNLDLTMHETGLINGMLSGGAQDPGDRLIIPGNPNRSALLSRVASANGYSRMPPLATNESDLVAIQLLTDWINQEATIETDYNTWRIARFGNDTSPEGQPDADPDGDSFSNEYEYRSHTDPSDGNDFLATGFSFTQSGSAIEINIPALSNRAVLVEHSSDLLKWLPWTAETNDGIPRNPAQQTVPLIAPATGNQEYFRLRIQER
jgi:glucose/arabinose dehydrogenase